MKNTKKMICALSVCLVAALFVGFTAIACGKTTQTDANEGKSLTIINSTDSALTDVRLVYNNDDSTTDELTVIDAGDSVAAALPGSGIYTVQISGETKDGKIFSGTFSGSPADNSFISISLDEADELTTTSNIVE